MARNWTPEERAKQAAAIRKWKPWQQSTGPKTTAGKAASSQNALKHGFDSAAMDDLRRVLRAQRQYLKNFSEFI